VGVTATETKDIPEAMFDFPLTVTGP